MNKDLEEFLAEVEKNHNLSAALEDAEARYLACYNAKCEVDCENERLRDLLAFNGINPNSQVESSKGARFAYDPQP